MLHECPLSYLILEREKEIKERNIGIIRFIIDRKKEIKKKY